MTFASCSWMHRRRVRPHRPDPLQELDVVTEPAKAVLHVLAFAACAAFAGEASAMTGMKVYVVAEPEAVYWVGRDAGDIEDMYASVAPAVIAVASVDAAVVAG